MRAFVRVVALALLGALLSTPARATCFAYTDPFACAARATSDGCSWCFGGSFGGFCAPRAKLYELRALGACEQTLDEAHRLKLVYPSPSGVIVRAPRSRDAR